MLVACKRHPLHPEGLALGSAFSCGNLAKPDWGLGQLPSWPPLVKLSNRWTTMMMILNKLMTMITLNKLTVTMAVIIILNKLTVKMTTRMILKKIDYKDDDDTK